jgi:hypothetical protein
VCRDKTEESGQQVRRRDFAGVVWRATSRAAIDRGDFVRGTAEEKVGAVEPMGLKRHTRREGWSGTQIRRSLGRGRVARSTEARLRSFLEGCPAGEAVRAGPESAVLARRSSLTGSRRRKLMQGELVGRTDCRSRGSVRR